MEAPLSYYAYGKLLLFGEYLILRGGKGLAIPLSSGQKLQITPVQEKGTFWQCLEFGTEWLTIHFSEDLSILKTTDKNKALLVQNLLLLIKAKRPDIAVSGLAFRFDLDFHRRYGFGTSATLISLLSQWSEVNPYFLLGHSFGGSGYDIPAATAQEPFLYNMIKKRLKNCALHKEVTGKLLFIYTGQKQESAAEVAAFRKMATSYRQIAAMNTIVEKAANCTKIAEWEALMEDSEQLLSSILEVPTVKKQLFKDYPYAIKSLGAWGGDFIMASFRDLPTARKYFRQKDMNPLYTYDQLIR